MSWRGARPAAGLLMAQHARQSAPKFLPGAGKKQRWPAALPTSTHHTWDMVGESEGMARVVCEGRSAN